VEDHAGFGVLDLGDESFAIADVAYEVANTVAKSAARARSR